MSSSGVSVISFILIYLSGVDMNTSRLEKNCRFMMRMLYDLVIG